MNFMKNNNQPKISMGLQLYQRLLHWSKKNEAY